MTIAVTAIRWSPPDIDQSRVNLVDSHRQRNPASDQAHVGVNGLALSALLFGRHIIARIVDRCQHLRRGGSYDLDVIKREAIPA